MKYQFIEFIMGPMVWISLAVFLIGLLLKTINIIRQVHQKESFVFSFLSLRYSLRSIAAWLIPFYPKSARVNPVFYGVSYLFHIALLIVPIFLSAHIVVMNEAFSLTWIALDNLLADIFTIYVILALVYFAFRRSMVPHVKDLTTIKDYLLIVMVGLPFLTGFLAYHQVMFYENMMIAHVIFGEVVLIMIPFTRFSHMITGPLSRAYTGSEFGGVRHAKDW
jgi:nitrate reductase gamma subunit